MSVPKETPEEKRRRVALETAWRQMVHGRYGGTKKGALKAMGRRLPGMDPAKNETELDLARVLAQRCHDLVHGYQKKIAWLDHENDPGMLHLFDDLFKAEFPHYELAICQTMFHMCINWYIQR
jgi:hypothetical protein